MALVGTLTFFNQRYVYMEASFAKGTRQLLLVSETDLDAEEGKEHLTFRGAPYYNAGGVLEDNYLLGILDPVRKKQYGTVPVLDAVYTAINEVIRQAKLANTVTHYLGVDKYTHGESTIEKKGSTLTHINLVTDKMSLEASETYKLNIKPRRLAQMMTDMNVATTRYNTATFVDASLEYVQRIGFDTSWLETKDYVEIHSLEEWDNLVIPALMKEYRRWKKEQDFPYFLVSIDFESDGLNAFCELHPDRHTAVYFSISFADNQSFGVFLKMENFENVDLEGMAERLTYLTQVDLNKDRDIVLQHGDDKLELKRSDLTVIAHNMMIDRRFGMTVGADIWFNLCTLQLSFNLDPFMTKGINGLKHIVTKFFGIEYAELGEICGKKNKGMFKYLTDRRVIQMYGCADTDWHRLAAKKMIEIAREAKEYYTVDHVEQHMSLDSMYMNTKADADYQGMRINRQAFLDEYNEKTRILNLYHDFMSQYVGRVKAYKDYERLVVNAERYNIELDTISGRDIQNAPSFRVEKWSGKELLNVLFSVLGYPVLVKTKQNKKAKLEGRAFKEKPAVNTEALRYYLQYEATVEPDVIDECFNKQTSLEELKWFSMYLKDDYIDPVTGNVLISKEKFNSYRYPFMMVMNLISPLVKTITAELKPIVESNCEYVFSHCNMTSAVTRRDLNPKQTVSKKSKYNYIPYTDDYNYCAVDQSAVEIRILYGLSGDKNLIEPLNNPEKDSHTETAALMHQKPAYTITKDVRKGIKFLAFGRPYGKEVFSSCKDFYGDTSPEHMAEMAYLFNLYDTKLASVMKVLNEVRDKMDEPVNPPESLKAYLEFDPEKKYGRMINKFGYCQHLEIREGVEWFRQALRRKAGNFIIQGFASNLLRIIYMRMYREFWKRGWIQDRRIRIHLTVHDEVDMSYHKSLNPVEVMSVLYNALTVKMKGFPVFFVGINFGNSWGEAKQDEAELPVLLVQELDKAYKEGKYDNYDFGNHLTFFKTEREAYYRRRMHKELKAVNKNRNVWDIDYLSDAFTNYTVRSLFPDMFKEPLITLPKGCEDPVLLLTAYLPKFIADYVLDRDSRKHHLVYKGKALQITKDLLINQYATIDDLFNNKPKSDQSIYVEQEETHSTQFDLEAEADEMFADMGFDFDEAPLDADEYETDGIVDLDTGFLNVYNNVKVEGEEEFVEYGSIEARVQAENEAAKEKKLHFDNFKETNGKIILSVPAIKTFGEIRKMCVGRTSSNANSLQLFIKHGGKLTNMNKYDESFLRELDEFLTNNKKIGV